MVTITVHYLCNIYFLKNNIKCLKNIIKWDQYDLKIVHSL